MPSSIKSVLLTGATGNLGAVILEQLISANISVVAVVRSISEHRDYWDEKYSIQIKSGQLRLVEIPDLAAPKAFHPYTKGIDAIIHVATPLAYENVVEKVIKLGWPFNENVLTAARDSGSIKRVIITGSIVSAMHLPQQIFGSRVSADTWNDMTFEEGAESYRPAYMYMKTLSEQKSWAWMKAEKPAFDLVVILAPSITGKSIQPGYKANKQHLGGTPGAYRELFDRKELGFVTPWFM
jgi:NADPH-dependent methylglyoxal reductase